MLGTEGTSKVPQSEYWTTLWNSGDTPWHLDGVYPFYSKGHRVVGVEFLEPVAQEFFVDNSLPFEEAECPVLKCKIFQTPDKRLKIFVCSVFDLNKSCAGTMDIVWDRGALSSIDVELRDRYATLVKSLLSPNFSYALWTMVFDDSTYEGFPRNMPEAVVRELFAGKGMKIRFIDSEGPRPRPYTEAGTVQVWHLTE